MIGRADINMPNTWEQRHIDKLNELRDQDALRLAWVLDHLGPGTIAQLAQQAITEFEQAKPKSTQAAVLGPLTDALHNRLVS